MHAASKVKDLKDAETNLELVDPFKWCQFVSIYDSVQTLSYLSSTNNSENTNQINIYD